MQHVPAGFFPNEWNQTLGSFQRLVQQLAHMRTLLSECSQCSAENSDVAFIVEQMRQELDTLQHFTRIAETWWQGVSVDVASAAGRFSLDRPADDVAWCSSILNAAWHLFNGLRRELSSENAAMCVHRLPQHLKRIPDDIDHYETRITAELRAGALCTQQSLKPSVKEKESSTEHAVFALYSFDNIEFTNPSEAGNDFELTDEEKGAFERLVDYYGSGFDRGLPDTHLLAHWWNDFLRGPLRNVRIGTDEFRRSRAGLIRYNEFLDLADYAGVDLSQIGNLSLIELLELVSNRCESNKNRVLSSYADEIAADKKEPFLGLVFNHDSTLSRLGDAYKHVPPIQLAPQGLRLLKFIHESGSRGRTKGEIVPDIVANNRILTTEKNRLKDDLFSIDIDLGPHGEYVVRCTKSDSKTTP